MAMTLSDLNAARFASDGEPEHDHDVIAAARRRAAQLAASGDHESAADELEMAAGLNEAEGRLQQAMDDLAGAIALLPAGTHWLALTEKRAQLASTTNHPDAGDCWRALVTYFEQLGDDAGLARALFHAHTAVSHAEAMTMLLRGAALDGQGNGWAARCESTIAMYECRYADVAVIDERSLQLAREAGDHQLESLALGSIAHAYSFLGRTTQAIRTIRQANSLAGMRGDHRTMAKGCINLAELFFEELEPARGLAVCGDFAEHIRRYSLATWLPVQQMLEGRMLRRLGRLGESIERTGEAFAQLSQRSDDVINTLIAFEHANGLVEIGGSAEEIDEALRATHACLEIWPFASFGFEVAFLEARLLAHRGDVAAAAAACSDLEIDEPPTMAYMALWLARTGSWHDCAAMSQQAAAIAATLADESGPFLQLAIAEVAAYALEGREATAALQSCGERWTDTDMRIDALRVRISIALRGLAGTGRQAAIDALMEVHHELVDIGALADADHVASVLRREAGGVEGGSIGEPLLLAGLTPRERAELERRLASTAFQRGKVFFTPDEAPSAIYFLRSGRVRLTRASAEGKQLTVAVLDRGAVFGEGALLGVRTTGLQAEAIEDGHVGVMSAGQLRSLIQDVPRIALNMLEFVGQRLDRSEQMAEEIAYWSVRRRFVRLVLELDERYGHPTLDGHRVINQSFTQGELAEMVGATRKAVALLIGELRREGIIDLRGKRLVVCDAAALRRMRDVPE